MKQIEEHVSWKTEWTIHKWGKDPDNQIATFLQHGGKIEDVPKLFGVIPTVEKIFGNIALEEGLYLLCGLISGIDVASDKWDAAHAYIGVGNGTDAESDADTGLKGASKSYKGMDGSYPARAATESAEDQFVEWRATFGSAEGNHAWEEFTVVNASTDTGKNLNRKVTSKGTKVSGESWTASVKITFA